MCTVIKSQRGQISSRGSCWTPKEAETSGAMMGSYPIVWSEVRKRQRQEQTSLFLISIGIINNGGHLLNTYQALLLSRSKCRLTSHSKGCYYSTLQMKKVGLTHQEGQAQSTKGGLFTSKLLTTNRRKSGVCVRVCTCTHVCVWSDKVELKNP